MCGVPLSKNVNSKKRYVVYLCPFRGRNAARWTKFDIILAWFPPVCETPRCPPTGAFHFLGLCKKNPGFAQNLGSSILDNDEAGLAITSLGANGNTDRSSVAFP